MAALLHDLGYLLSECPKRDDVDAVWSFGQADKATLVERESIGNLTWVFAAISG